MSKPGASRPQLGARGRFLGIAEGRFWRYRASELDGWLRVKSNSRIARVAGELGPRKQQNHAGFYTPGLMPTKRQAQGRVVKSLLAPCWQCRLLQVLEIYVGA